ncbi:MAG TPA: uroporphyrinogen decarboxylase family protein [Vicinamibacterales bacterium]|nr:uroporphyrinogen decarboxylase family protein [Vicinamibacterales bacterium]
MTSLPLLPTTLVGSYPQPDWLIDRALLGASTPPRVRMRELWRVAPEFLEQAQDDATLIALRDQERAGIDIVSDGEMRRESYFNRFATALAGIDLDNPGQVISRTGKQVPVPRVVGKVKRMRPVNVRDVRFLRANTSRQIKITVPGPFTMTQLAQNDAYQSNAELAMDYAAAVNEEIKDLLAAGADVVQIDEPYMQAHPDEAREFGLAAFERALDGVQGTTAVHICFGYGSMVKGKPARYAFLPELSATAVQQVSVETAQPSLDCSVLKELPNKTILLGVLDLSTSEVETPQLVADRINRALPYVDPQRLIIAPDCGLKYLSREVAFGKLEAMVDGARLVRAQIQGV